METYTPTERTQVKRLPKRGVYDHAQVHAILDEGFICHVGFVADGQPYVIPTGYARSGDQLYIHGSAASRMLRALGQGAQLCVTVTLVDGLVLARSAFHHSMNYRSVVVLGQARVVTDPEEKTGGARPLHQSHRARALGRSPPAHRAGTEEHHRAWRWRSTKFPRKSAPADPSTTKRITRCRSGRVWFRCACEAGEPLPDARLPEGVPAIDRRRFASRHT